MSNRSSLFDFHGFPLILSQPLTALGEAGAGWLLGVLVAW